MCLGRASPHCCGARPRSASEKVKPVPDEAELGTLSSLKKAAGNVADEAQAVVSHASTPELPSAWVVSLPKTTQVTGPSPGNMTVKLVPLMEKAVVGGV